MQTTLLIIDPQNDFCDPDKGALAVKGADQDMRRLASAIRAHSHQINAIYVTLDSHHPVHIAHPIFWKDVAGNHPDPFTLISAEEVETGRWSAAIPSLKQRARDYTRALEAGGRYRLCIWPEHCLIGSEGHAVIPELFSALREWEHRFAIVNYIEKGSNPYTEHYSAIRAELPDPNDPGTRVNTALIEQLKGADRLLIAGEAGSHCVANTVRDLADRLNSRDALALMTLITDAISPVPGFESLQEEFFEEMRGIGIQFATTESLFGV